MCSVKYIVVVLVISWHAYEAKTTPQIRRLAETLTSFKNRVQLLNQGTVYNTDVFVRRSQPCAYLEAENVSTVFNDWSVNGKLEYLYKKLPNGTLVVPPSGMRSAVPLGGIGTGHVELRGDGTLREWTIVNQTPASAAKIQIYDNAMFGVRTSTKSEPNKHQREGNRTKKRTTYSFWSLLSSLKRKRPRQQQYPDVFMYENSGYDDPGIVKDDVQAFSLRTHPPTGIPGVKALRYSGSHPFSLLEVLDDRLPVNVSLAAFSAYTVGDMNTSNTPAISFVFSIKNPSTVPVSVSVMFNLPFSLETNQQRMHVPLPNGHGQAKADRKHSFMEDSKYNPGYGTHERGSEKHAFRSEHKQHDIHKRSVSSDIECMKLCNTITQCQSWTYFALEESCSLSTTANLNTYNQDASSGLKGAWSPSTTTNLKCITLDRPGVGAPHGNISICGSADQHISVGAGDSLTDAWSQFEKVGQFTPPSGPVPSVQGVISATVNVQPKEELVVPIVLAYYFPNRDFIDRIYGNWYQHRYKSSEEVAQDVIVNQFQTLKAIQDMQDAFTSQGSSLPYWLSDILVNSLGHIRSSMWFADGRWRQWEAVDCTNIDSVHNDGERHIPYIMFFPDSTKSKMTAWAKSQLPNGMIQEQLRWGCPLTYPHNWMNPVFDQPGGRVMSDVSSMFIVYLLEFYRWNNDKQLLLDLWPVAKKAAQWHMDVSDKYGLPLRLQNTYDILGLDRYDLCTYNSAFHLLGMRAAEEVAKVAGDTSFAAKSRQAFLVGQRMLDKFLWNETARYYNSYVVNVTSTNRNQGAIMTDCFYAQVISQTVGLGSLLANDTRLSLHLDAELSHNDSPYGLLVQTGRYKYPGPSQDNAIWLMGNPNWATNRIRLGKDATASLEVAKKSLEHWRTGLNEQWNVAGIEGGIGYGADGQPWATSHYGYYMSSWHVIFALSGQQADLPAGLLTFDPMTAPPYNYPVMLPGILGTLASSIQGNSIDYTINLSFGSVTIAHVRVSNSTAPHSPITLSPGIPYSWTDTK